MTTRVGLAHRGFHQRVSELPWGWVGRNLFNPSFGSGEVAFSQGNASEKVTKTQESESA